MSRPRKGSSADSHNFGETIDSTVQIEDLNATHRKRARNASFSATTNISFDGDMVSTLPWRLNVTQGNILDEADQVQEEIVDETTDPPHRQSSVSSGASGSGKHSQPSTDSTSSITTGYIMVGNSSLQVSGNVYNQGKQGACYAYTIASAVRMMQRFHNEDIETTPELVKWITGRIRYGNIIKGGDFFLYFQDFTEKYKHWILHVLPRYEEPTHSGTLLSTLLHPEKTFRSLFEPQTGEGWVNAISLQLTENEWNQFKEFHAYELPTLPDVEIALQDIINKINNFKPSRRKSRFEFTDKEIKMLIHIHLKIQKYAEESTLIDKLYRRIVELHSPEELELPKQSCVVRSKNVKIEDVEFDLTTGFFTDRVHNQIVDNVTGHACVVLRVDGDTVVIKNSWGENWGFIGGVFCVSFGWLHELYKRNRVYVCSLQSTKDTKRKSWISHTSGKLAGW